MTKEEFKDLGEKIADNLASPQEIIAFSEELNNEIKNLSRELSNN